MASHTTAATKRRLGDWLDDLCVRFIVNLPPADLSSMERICFHMEEAHWFYEDFIRPEDASLPSMSLRTFLLRLFQHCPLFRGVAEDRFAQAFDEFMQYKRLVPVRGAIMLNQAMDKAVLVRGWKASASWGFPKGKINKDEDDLDCAIREVYEETGYDLRQAGRVPGREFAEFKYIERSLQGQQIRLFVFRNVPEDTHFATRTKREIGDIRWYKLRDLPAYKATGKKGQDQNKPGKFYMVSSFVDELKQWIAQLRQMDLEKAAEMTESQADMSVLEDVFTEDVYTEDEVPAGGFEQAGPSQQQQQQSQPHAQPQLEPLPAASHTTSDDTTEMLRSMLQGQLHSNEPQARSDDNAGAALMSILQAKAKVEALPVTTGNNYEHGYGYNPDGGHHHVQNKQHLQPQNQYNQFNQYTNQHSQQFLHTPLEQVITRPPQPDTPQHHHVTAQQFPFSSNYQQPSSFPVAPQTAASEGIPGQQYQARPRIQMTTDSNGQPTVQVAPREHRPRQPIGRPPQLLHPQPQLPPSQQVRLIRDMQTPILLDQPGSVPYGAQANQPHRQQLPQGQLPQGLTNQMAGVNPPQPPPHASNLLGLFKGNNPPQVNNQHQQSSSQQMPTHQQSAHQSPQNQASSTTTHHHHQNPHNPHNPHQHAPTSHHGSPHSHHQSSPQQPHGPRPLYADMYGNKPASSGAFSATSNPATNSSGIPLSLANFKPAPQSEKHRADLLGMFKKSENANPTTTASSTSPTSMAQRSAPADQRAPRSRNVSHGSNHSTHSQPHHRSQQQQQQPHPHHPHHSHHSSPLDSKPPSTAEALRQAAQDNIGRPLVMNPDLNLPFGALSIATRPRQGRQSPAQKAGAAARTPRSPRSPGPLQGGNGGSSFSSPQQARYIPSGLQRMHVAGSGAAKLEKPEWEQAGEDEDEPTYASLYRSAAASQTSPFANANMGTAQPPRYETSVEQKNQLLSLFGMSQNAKNAAGGGKAAESVPGSVKGKENSRTGSRSSTMLNHGGGGSERDTDSRQGNNQTPLSPADRDFLLGFLYDASKKGTKT